MVTDICDI
jgi:hypothetical protein